MGTVKKILSRYSTLCLVVILSGVFFRLYPITTNPYRQRQRVAEFILRARLQQHIVNHVAQTNPQLSPIQKQQIVSGQYKVLSQKNLAEFRKAARKIAQTQLKGILRFYLLGADSYFYLQLTRAIISHGAISETIKDGYYYNPLSMAPLGTWRKFELHPYVGFVIYRICSFLSPAIDLVTALSLTPLFLFAVSIPLFVLLCKRLNLQKFSIFIAATFLALSPVFIQRSSFGWYDTDPYNVIFIMLMMIGLVTYCQSKRPFVAVILLGCCYALYALFWQGWVLLLIFHAITMSIVFLMSSLRNQRRFLTHIGLFLLLVFSACVLSCIVLTPKGLASSLREARDIFSGFLFIKTSGWPDIFLTVGELKKASLLKIISYVGGIVFFSISLVGFLVGVSSKRHRNQNPAIVCLSVLFLLFLLLATNAERFIIFLLAPTAVMFAFGLDRMYFWVLRLHALRNQHDDVGTLRIIRVAFCCLLFIPPLHAQQEALKQIPIFNEVWDAALTRIKHNTPKTSIINSWWPPGHFIKAIAERGVTFDGATINSPAAYWIASALLSDDEDHAAGILRMLNASGNQACEFLQTKGFDLPAAVDLIHRIVPLSQAQARRRAYDSLSREDADRLIALTHAPDAPSYCLIYNELAEKAIGLYYVKAWDFKKAALIQKKRQAAIQKGNIFWRGSSDNVDSIWEISGGATYIGEESPQVYRVDETAYFSNGVKLNTKLMQAQISNLEGKISGIPASVLFVKDNRLIEKMMPNATMKLSILIIDHPDKALSCIVSVPPVLKSLLFRLYYLNGVGLQRFTRIILEENPLLKTKISVYQIHPKK